MQAAGVGVPCASVDPPFRFETLFTDDFVGVYRHRSLLTLVWRTTPSVKRLAQPERALAAAARITVGGALLCALADASWPLPDGETRAALTAAIKRMGPLRAVANVVSGSGFQAAAMRALLSGFSMAIRPKYPVAIVGTAQEGASFLVSHWPGQDPPPPGGAELSVALASIAPRRA